MTSAMRTHALVAMAIAVGQCLGQQVSNPTPQMVVQQDESQPAGLVFRLTGRVVDELTGKPLSGATVRLSLLGALPSKYWNAPRPPKPPPPRETIAGNDGSFAFDDVPTRNIDLSSKYPPGYQDSYDLKHVPTTNIELQAFYPGYRDVWDFLRTSEDVLQNGFMVVGDRTGPVLVRLAPITSVGGVLRDLTGMPVSRQPEIRLFRLPSPSGWTGVVEFSNIKFGPDGTFEFQNLPPGNYYLVASSHATWKPTRYESGQAIGEVPIRYPTPTAQNAAPFFTVREGEPVHLDLRVQEGRLYHVLVSGSPVSPLTCSLFDSNGSYFNLHWISDDRAEAWLPNGLYHLSNGREGEISGPDPFRVENADRSDLHYRILPQYSGPIQTSSSGKAHPKR